MANVSWLSDFELIVDEKRYTAKVYARHRETCPDREEGMSFANCTCWKSIMTWDGEKQRLITARTRSWGEAAKRAKAWLAQFDPNAQKAKKIEADQKTVEEAVRLFVEAKANGTFAPKARSRGRLGCADATIRAFTFLLGDGKEKKGRLGEWLDTLPFRPRAISDLTPELVNAFRASWKTYNDVTSFVNWTNLKNFFVFCRAMRWIEESPARDLPHVKVAKGNRTAPFSDDEYEAIRRKAFESANPRLLVFLELMRHSGMALEDAVTFRTDSVRGDVLTYRRAKTGNEAIVVLPPHVLELLATLPLGQPFLDTSVQLASSKQAWRRLLQDLFKAAGVETLQTDVGPRPAHPHALRDTFAVDMITRPGATTRDVAKMLGDSEKVTAKHYLPFAEKLRNYHVEKMREMIRAR